jgi:glycosyltransferase involved in cell wall biosynthesis
VEKKNGLLMVANWDSNVGYAWWLMEGFWAAIAKEFHDKFKCRIAYPSISVIPETITTAPIIVDHMDFVKCDVRSIAKQCRYLIRHCIKVVYFTDQATRHWRYLAFRLCGVKIIIAHDHTPGVRTIPVGPKRWAKSALQRLPFYTANALFSVSEYVRQRHVEVLCAPATRCYVVQNGIPVYSPMLMDPYAEFNIPRNQKIIVTVGRLAKYKGIQDALSFLAKINDKNWHYLVIGDGPNLQEFEKLVKTLGLASNVTFAGNRKDVKDLLPHCCFGIHPSHGEAFSLAILELMQAGLPVIVSTNPSVCGAISNEVGIKYSTPAEAQNAIHLLLNDPVRVEKMGIAAKQIVRRNYSIENTHRQLIDAFSKLLTL